MAVPPAAPRRHPRDRLAILRSPSGGPAVTGMSSSDGAPEGLSAPAGVGGPGVPSISPPGDLTAESGPSLGHVESPSAEAADGDAAEGGGRVANGTAQGGDDSGGDAVAARRTPAVPGAAGRLVRRWLPVDAARWRLDPGRRAASVLAAVVLLGAALAGVAVWRSRPIPEPVPALAAAVEISGAAQAGSAELVVSVAGLVVRPGLVRLAPGARVADAVEAAGGPVPGTDLTGVNLARRLTDGEHVVVGPAAPGQPAGDAPSGSGSRVDLNTATLAELDALPGIGPVTARRILDWRAAHGRFASVDQLREVDGIGEARFAQLRDLVTA